MINVDSFLQKFPWAPTVQQLQAFQLLAQFVNQASDFDAFVLKGYAGTGKTTIISTLVQTMQQFKLPTVLLAPTGRAAKVMSQYAGKNAWTIHKKIYRKKNTTSPEMSFGAAHNMHENTLFIIDESSMISNERSSFQGRSLLDDLIKYVRNGKGCRLIFVGDTAQLPPVGYQESPALDSGILQSYFGLRTLVYELQEVVRQAEASGILHNATRIRKQINLDPSQDQEMIRSIPQLKLGGFKDIFRMTGERLIEGLNYAYDKYGMENTLVICRSNKHAVLYNQHIRNTILFRDEELSGGDHIMVVRNNYFWLSQDEATSSKNARDFIANGDMAVVKRVRNIHEQYGFRFADVTMEFMDMEENAALECRVILDTLHASSPNLSQEDQQLLYERIAKDYAENAPDSLKNKNAWMKTDPYFNALQIKFAMAITCHKSQGGQWDAVFVDQGYIQDEGVNEEFLRWLYTACTRAKQELFLVNFHQLFFAETKS